jgi:spermidine synthase
MLKFTEDFEVGSGRTVQIDIKKELYSAKTDFQDIAVLDTVPYGRMLTLDGIIQLTQFDNHAYHEMITHVPMHLTNAKKVLIIGGGDGGVLKEVIKYDSVEEVVLCDIDPEVTTISKEYFEEFRAAFLDKRAIVIHKDAAKYVQEKKDYFDVVLIDSSDPIGPAVVLYEQAFYQNVYNAMTKDGIMSCQMESMYYHHDFIKEKITTQREMFNSAEYYYTMIPTYPGGSIGFSLCKKGETLTKKTGLDENTLNELKYYTKEIHNASFVLPKFMGDI